MKAPVHGRRETFCQVSQVRLKHFIIFFQMVILFPPVAWYMKDITRLGTAFPKPTIKAVKVSLVECILLMCTLVQCLTMSSVSCSAVQYSAVHYSAVQCSTVQCSAVQCSAVQCCAGGWEWKDHAPAQLEPWKWDLGSGGGNQGVCV